MKKDDKYYNSLPDLEILATIMKTLQSLEILSVRKKKRNLTYYHGKSCEQNTTYQAMTSLLKAGGLCVTF